MSRNEQAGGDAQTDFRSLVKLVLTRPERHELRDLTESKRAGRLSAEGRTRLRELKEIVSAAATAQEQLKVAKASNMTQPQDSHRNDGRSGQSSPQPYDVGYSEGGAGFQARPQVSSHSRPSLPGMETPRNSMVMGPYTAALGPKGQAASEANVGRRVRKDFGSHGVFEGLVVGVKVIAGASMLYFKIRYEDGDEEDVSQTELDEILVPNDKTAPSADKRGQQKAPRAGKLVPLKQEEEDEAGESAVALLVSQTGCSVAEGERVLQKRGGDISLALLELRKGHAADPLPPKTAGRIFSASASPIAPVEKSASPSPEVHTGIVEPHESLSSLSNDDDNEPAGGGVVPRASAKVVPEATSPAPKASVGNDARSPKDSTAYKDVVVGAAKTFTSPKVKSSALAMRWMAKVASADDTTGKAAKSASPLSQQSKVSTLGSVPLKELPTGKGSGAEEEEQVSRVRAPFIATPHIAKAPLDVFFPPTPAEEIDEAEAPASLPVQMRAATPVEASAPAHVSAEPPAPPQPPSAPAVAKEQPATKSAAPAMVSTLRGRGLWPQSSNETIEASASADPAPTVPARASSPAQAAPVPAASLTASRSSRAPSEGERSVRSRSRSPRLGGAPQASSSRKFRSVSPRAEPKPQPVVTALASSKPVPKLSAAGRLFLGSGRYDGRYDDPLPPAKETPPPMLPQPQQQVKTRQASPMFVPAAGFRDQPHNVGASASASRLGENNLDDLESALDDLCVRRDDAGEAFVWGAVTRQELFLKEATDRLKGVRSSPETETSYPELETYRRLHLEVSDAKEALQTARKAAFDAHAASVQSLKEELARAKSEAVATATSDLDKEAEQAARKHEFERLEAELSSSLNLKLEERDQYHARATEAIKAEAAEATRTLVAQHAQVVHELRGEVESSKTAAQKTIETQVLELKALKAQVRDLEASRGGEGNQVIAQKLARAEASVEEARGLAKAMRRERDDAQRMHVKSFLRGALGRKASLWTSLAWSRWFVHTLRAAASQRKNLRSEVNELHRHLADAQRQGKESEQQTGALANQLARAQNIARAQDEDRARRVAALVSAKATAVAAEDFEAALRCTQEIKALHTLSQLIEQQNQAASPLRLQQEERFPTHMVLDPYANLASLALSPVPGSRSPPVSDYDSVVRRLGNHGTVVVSQNQSPAKPSAFEPFKPVNDIPPAAINAAPPLSPGLPTGNASPLFAMPSQEQPLPPNSSAVQTPVSGPCNVSFEVALADHSVSSFDADASAAFRAATASALGVGASQVEVTSVRAGSVVVETKVVGVNDHATAASMSQAAANPMVLAASLAKAGLGRCQVSEPFVSSNTSQPVRLPAEPAAADKLPAEVAPPAAAPMPVEQPVPGSFEQPKTGDVQLARAFTQPEVPVKPASRPSSLERQRPPASSEQSTAEAPKRTFAAPRASSRERRWPPQNTEAMPEKPKTAVRRWQSSGNVLASANSWMKKPTDEGPARGRVSPVTGAGFTANRAKALLEKRRPSPPPHLAVPLTEENANEKFVVPTEVAQADDPNIGVNGHSNDPVVVERTGDVNESGSMAPAQKPPVEAGGAGAPRMKKPSPMRHVSSNSIASSKKPASPTSTVQAPLARLKRPSPSRVSPALNGAVQAPQQPQAAPGAPMPPSPSGSVNSGFGRRSRSPQISADGGSEDGDPSSVVARPRRLKSPRFNPEAVIARLSAEPKKPPSPVPVLPRKRGESSPLRRAEHPSKTAEADNQGPHKKPEAEAPLLRKNSGNFKEVKVTESDKSEEATAPVAAPKGPKWMLSSKIPAKNLSAGTLAATEMSKSGRLQLPPSKLVTGKNSRGNSREPSPQANANRNIMTSPRVLPPSNGNTSNASSGQAVGTPKLKSTATYIKPTIGSGVGKKKYESMVQRSGGPSSMTQIAPGSPTSPNGRRSPSKGKTEEIPANSMRHQSTGWAPDDIGALCWVSDKHSAYVPAKITVVTDTTVTAVADLDGRIYEIDLRAPIQPPKRGSPSRGLHENRRKSAIGGFGEVHEAPEEPRRLLPRVANSSKFGVDNMDDLPVLHEASILDNVDLRFRVDKIYTNTGTILIAMNPFKWLPLYGTEVMKQYMNKAHGTMPPHCFAEAEAAHQAIHSADSSKDQAIVICGESGAGKTETTKLILAYLSFVSESKDKTKTSVVSPLSPQKVPKGPESTDLSVSERLVESSPLLEALGNAKTQRNNNSSRFGKFTALHYKSAGGATGQIIIGGKLTNLLLESSRVVFQPHNERNYHIFFQLLSCSAKDRSTHGLGALQQLSAADCAYTNDSGCVTVGGMHDGEEFEHTLRSMTAVQIQGGAKKHLLQTIAGVLVLGNIEFQDDKLGEACFVTEASKYALEAASELLGLGSSGATLLAEALSTQVRELPGGESLVSSNNALESRSLRDALAKALYTRLFDSTVEAINKAVSPSEGTSGNAGERIIGVLDIFGFEDQLHNGFEQLFINTTNESLQSVFNAQVFKAEALEYTREEILWDPTAFPDNTPTVELLEKRPLGLLPMLDSECRRGASASDGEALTRSFNKNHGEDSKAYAVCGLASVWKRRDGSRTQECDFLVHHYAGDVVYTVHDFIPKNRDALYVHVQELMATSQSNGLMKTMFADAEKHKGSKGKSTHEALTVSSKFLSQLSILKGILDAADTRFVRCIKTNDSAAPQEVNKPSVLHQLVCSGVMAALEVRRAGFPNRMLYRDFVKEFRVFTPPGAKFRNMIDDEELAMEMLLHPAVSARVPLSAFRPGNTKLFMSADTPFVLRNLRHTLLYPYVRRLQLWWQRRENDVNQRKVASAKRNITAAQDKAALCAVHGVASVRKATETALRILDKAKEAALLSSWGNISRDAPDLLKTMSELAEASKACVEAVDSAVERKEEAGHIRAEVLGQLDSQQERLNQVRASAMTLHNDAAREALLATALAAESELRSCRHEMLIAASAWDEETGGAASEAAKQARHTSRGLDRSTAVARKMLRFKALMNRRAAAMGRKVGMGRQASFRLQSAQKVDVQGEAYSLDLLREQFATIDSDGSGEIDASELAAAMEALGEKGVTVLEAQHMIDSVDRDGNDTLNFDEFIVLMSRGAKRGGPLERAVDAMCARVREEEAERRRQLKGLSPKGGNRKNEGGEPLGEVDSMRSAFFAIDADQSGEIDPNELASAMATMSANEVTTDIAADLMAQVDFDLSGTLSYDEFVFLMTKWNARGGDQKLHEAFSMVKARVSKIEELRAQFDRVDVDLSGEIDAAELSLAMVGAGQKDVGEAEAAELIDLVDKDGTGTLDFEEFVAMMTQIDIAINGGSEAAREERLNHAFDLVRVAEAMEERYLEDKRAMDAASRELTIRLESDKARLEEGVSHSERFLAAGMRRVADACHDAKHAVVEAERALKGLEAEGYRRAVDAVTHAVDELLRLVESEDERLLWLESLRTSEHTVFMIRSQAAESGTQLLETSPQLREAIEEAEGKIVKFTARRRQFSANAQMANGRATAEELFDGALLMELSELKNAADDLSEAASKCQTIFDDAADAAHKEQHERINSIRSKFEKSAHAEDNASSSSPRPPVRSPRPASQRVYGGR